MLDPASLRACCGSDRWVELMLASLARPADSPLSTDAVLAAADRAFDTLSDDDWLQAFSAHPRIGEPDRGDARDAAEQAGAADADAATEQALREGNLAYEARFGHVFLIRATGLSAAEMLAALNTRLGNPPDVELRIAADHERQIIALRLRDMIEAS